jgi:uncharacterized membrane protein YGL010W
MRPHLLSWQYQGYPEFHRNRTNLLLHLVAVPAFVLSFAWLAVSTVTLHWTQMAAGSLGMVVSFLVQGVGHRREAAPPIPFAGPGDAVSRILTEQFVTFPRFVFSGGFGRALKAAAPAR